MVGDILRWRLDASAAGHLLGRLRQDVGAHQTIVELVTMVGVYAFLLNYYRPDLLLSATTTTGGDTGSHIVLSQYLQDYLLPRGKVIGWYPHWLAGLPMLQFYFVPPYLLMALLGYVIPREVAFKLISSLGVFLLPLCSYYSMRLLGFKFPAPILTATFAPVFLFNENYTIYGGNIPSTLAGEFSYGISLALTFLSMALLYDSMRTGKRFITTSVTIALAFLTHVYTSVFLAGVIVLLGLHTLATRNVARLRQMLKIGALSFLLVAFWYIPLIVKYPYASPPTARFFAPANLGEIFYDSLFIFNTLAFATLLLAVFDREKKIVYLGASLLIAIAIFFGWDYIVTYNHVRFIPIVVLLILPLAAHAVYRLATKYDRFRRSPAFTVLPLISLLLVAGSLTQNRYAAADCTAFRNDPLRNPLDQPYCYIPGRISFSGSWIRWNYEGLETKYGWATLQRVFDAVRKLPAGGRVDFEYGDYGSYGTPRVFEASPYFTDRSVMEALLLETSLTFPFFYYIQRSVSQTSWWPAFPLDLPVFNLTEGAKRLRMYNVEYFVAYAPATKQAARNHSDFEPIDEVGGFEIFRVKGNSGYVQPLERKPVLVVTKDWRTFSFQWFSSNYTDTILAYTGAADEYDAEHFEVRIDAETFHGQYGTYQNDKWHNGIFQNETFVSQIGQSGSTPLNCTVTSTIREEELSFTTDCVGAPHLVKISYFPNWRVEGARRIYLVSPNLMLVFPDQENVRLYYGYTLADAVGNLLTLAGLVSIGVYLAVAAHRKVRKPQMSPHQA